jgi:hypothetical protein
MNNNFKPLSYQKYFFYFSPIIEFSVIRAAVLLSNLSIELVVFICAKDNCKAKIKIEKLK